VFLHWRKPAQAYDSESGAGAAAFIAAWRQPGGSMAAATPAYAAAV